MSGAPRFFPKLLPGMTVITESKPPFMLPKALKEGAAATVVSIDGWVCLIQDEFGTREPVCIYCLRPKHS